jgi:hypothetical protein
MFKYAAILFGALGLVSSSYAADDATTDTGNELVEMCNDGNYQAQNSAWGDCITFIHGVISGYDTGLTRDITFHYPNETNDEWLKRFYGVRGYCFPDKATREQTALVTSKYLHDHPEKLNKTEAVLVILALVDAWPCGK